MKFTDKSPIPDWETLLKSQDFVKAISEMQILREGLKQILRNLPKMALFSAVV